jgi:glucose/arabinose dehydrogenase
MKLRNLLLTSLLLSVVTNACAADTTSVELSDSDFVYFPLPTDLNSGIINSQDQNFIVQEVVTGLNGVPWGMTFLPDGSVLITERQGNLRRVVNGQLLPEYVENVPEVFSRGQGGLLDINLHPNYDENGWIYISFSEPTGDLSHTSIIRAKLNGNALTDIQSIFKIEPYTNRGHHFGSRIEFDNDGYLYFTIGDRGQMADAQKLDIYAGKTFRIHDDGRIPADNPFVGQEGALPEIYTYGNRNQQGLIKHPKTGEMWSHEHGPRGGDEINILRAGINYGWPEISYGINYNGSIITEDTARAGMEQPIHYWTPSIAPSGMIFVTSNKYPNWIGDLVTGSLSYKFIQRTVLDGKTVVKEEKLLEDIGRVRNIKQGPDGYIYFATDDGKIRRLIPVE